MLLFGLWAVLVIGALAAAGYSHYRYRARNNQYYARLFAADRVEPVGPDLMHERDSILPVLTLVIVSVLVPASLIM